MAITQAEAEKLADATVKAITAVTEPLKKRIAALEAAAPQRPSVKWAGVYDAAKSYAPGDLVTRRGLWLVTAATSPGERPKVSDHFELILRNTGTHAMIDTDPLTPRDCAAFVKAIMERHGWRLSLDDDGLVVTIGDELPDCPQPRLLQFVFGALRPEFEAIVRAEQTAH